MSTLNAVRPRVGSGSALPWYIAEFVGQAPLGFRGGDANLRRYVGNRPTTFMDPSGLEGVSSIPSLGGSGAGIADGGLGGSLSSLGDMGGIDALYSSRSDQSGFMTDLLYRPGDHTGPTMVPLGPFDPSTLPAGGLIVPADNPAGPAPAGPPAKLRKGEQLRPENLPPSLRNGPKVDDSFPFVPLKPDNGQMGRITGKGMSPVEGLKAERDKWERKLGEALKGRAQPLISPERLKELNTEIDQLRGILQDIDRDLELLRPGPAPGRLPQFPTGPGRERWNPFLELPRDPERSFLPHSAVYPPVAPRVVERAPPEEVLNSFQEMLDIIGLVPVLGIPADGLNAVISAFRSHWVEAGLSLAAAVPFFGMGASAAKFFRRLNLTQLEGSLSKLRKIEAEALAKGEKQTAKEAREVIDLLEAEKARRAAPNPTTTPEPNPAKPPTEPPVPSARIPGGPFTGFPDWGRGTVKWGTGAKEAATRAAEITEQEAKALDAAKVRAAKEFYEKIYAESLKGNPNAAAKARAELMDRILQLQGGK